MHYIILRDVPKREACIDGSTFNIQGGFRGFQLVPDGVHYVGILDDNVQRGFWCYLQKNPTMVKLYNHTQKIFEDDDAESTAEFSNMAVSGVMAKALIRYPMEPWHNWHTVTRHIDAKDFPPFIQQETASVMPTNLSIDEQSTWMLSQHQSRFKLALEQTHRGNVSALLSEFQWAFLTGYVYDNDPQAYERWRHLLLAFYQAGESSIADFPDLFVKLVDTLIGQFQYLSEEMFSPESFVMGDIRYMVEDMMDTGIKVLVEKGNELSKYL